MAKDPKIPLVTSPRLQRDAAAAGMPREGVAPQLWVIGLVAIIIILLVFFGAIAA